MKRFISMIVVCCFLLWYVPSFAQEESSEKNEGQKVELKPIKSETFSEEALSRKFDTLRKMDKEIKAIDAHLKKKGFSPQTQKGKKNFWGIKETYEYESQQAESQDKKDKQKVIFTAEFQNYSKKNSRDTISIGQLTLTVDVISQTYSFYLLAPNGNVKAMEEFKVDQNLNISKANSWWSCVKNFLTHYCASVCVSSLITCYFTTPAFYIKCVIAACGGCGLAASMCCTCNCKRCSGWKIWKCCKYVVGCCHQ